MREISFVRPKINNFFAVMIDFFKIANSGYLTNNGKYLLDFESKLTSILKSKVCVFVNGHLALETAIKSLNLSGEVITTCFTFASTTQALINLNLKPVFCDIELESLAIDSKRIEELITSETSAILAVHPFGNACDVSQISAIANKYNLKVIYDAAHSFGMEIDNIPISSFGDITMFSFQATKVFHSVEGGALIVNSTDVNYDRIKSLRNFGLNKDNSIEPFGTNGKMSEFHAAIGLSNLKSLAKEIEGRKKVHHYYKDGLKNIPNITVPIIGLNVKSNYSYFIIIVHGEKKRDDLFTYLLTKRITTRRYFYPLTTSLTEKIYSVEAGNLENSIFSEKSALALPIYSNLKKREIDYVVNCIREFILR
jgi:dTDP-4-amino-4,6-dideoxygalactose transaminase